MANSVTKASGSSPSLWRVGKEALKSAPIALTGSALAAAVYSILSMRVEKEFFLLMWSIFFLGVMLPFSYLDAIKLLDEESADAVRARALASYYFLKVTEHVTQRAHIVGAFAKFNLVFLDTADPLSYFNGIGQFNLPLRMGGTVDLDFNSLLRLTAYRRSRDRESFTLNFSTPGYEISPTDVHDGMVMLFGKLLVVVRSDIAAAYTDVVKAGVPELKWLEHLTASAIIAKRTSEETTESSPD